MNATCLECLKVDSPYAMMEVTGLKTLEIKRQPTKKRGTIGIIDLKQKRLVGYVDLVDCLELSLDELKKLGDKHRANSFLDSYAKKRATLYAWVLTNPKLEHSDRPYTFSTGCWCFLKEATNL